MAKAVSKRKSVEWSVSACESSGEMCSSGEKLGGGSLNGKMGGGSSAEVGGGLLREEGLSGEKVGGGLPGEEKVGGGLPGEKVGGGSPGEEKVGGGSPGEEKVGGGSPGEEKLGGGLLEVVEVKVRRSLEEELFEEEGMSDSSDSEVSVMEYFVPNSPKSDENQTIFVQYPVGRGE